MPALHDWHPRRYRVNGIDCHSGLSRHNVVFACVLHTYCAHTNEQCIVVVVTTERRADEDQTGKILAKDKIHHDW